MSTQPVPDPAIQPATTTPQSPQREAAFAYLRALENCNPDAAEGLLSPQFRFTVHRTPTWAGADDDRGEPEGVGKVDYMRQIRAYAELTEKYELKIWDGCEAKEGPKVWVHTSGRVMLKSGGELKHECVWMFTVEEEVDAGGKALIRELKEFLLEVGSVDEVHREQEVDSECENATAQQASTPTVPCFLDRQLNNTMIPMFRAHATKQLATRCAAATGEN
ncbi:hypothetical protein EVG20_g8510 [Dentipellis fragilis]|uniref:SnoaL-like domain-containing protein n=1 Tax=Dentipellis fragilis TaxID=205917 RepID=A0A4Y9Y5U1_9AGAM|nr:hypothetical protein EVG20_g8510 [Dentipellis fragilis]